MFRELTERDLELLEADARFIDVILVGQLRELPNLVETYVEVNRELGVRSLLSGRWNADRVRADENTGEVAG